jgi:hypothetical protein
VLSSEPAVLSSRAGALLALSFQIAGKPGRRLASGRCSPASDSDPEVAATASLSGRRGCIARASGIARLVTLACALVEDGAPEARPRVQCGACQCAQGEGALAPARRLGAVLRSLTDATPLSA